MPVTRSSAGMERAATFINTAADMRAPFNFAEWGAHAEMTDATLLTLDEQGFTSDYHSPCLLRNSSIGILVVRG
jgi:hypothetical protein